MAIKQWKTFLMPYQQAVEELKIKFKSIRSEFKFRNEYSPIEFVTGRVKEVSSILEKTTLTFATHQNNAGFLGAFYHFKQKHEK